MYTKVIFTHVSSAKEFYSAQIYLDLVAQSTIWLKESRTLELALFEADKLPHS